jgi:ADP-ribose pyrophosphatase YjhB (NUDIX family)
MSSADKQGFTKGDRPAQANSVPVASPIPSAEHDVISITEVSTAVAIVRATSRGTQLLFMQRGDSKEFFKLPKGQVQEGEAEERAAERIALQEAGVRGIHVQASVLGQLQCKPKKIYQDQKVVRVIHETIRVFIATPTDVFDFESRDGVNLIWIFQDDVKMLIAGNFVDLGGRSIRLHAMYIQHMHIGELALNRFAVAVPFVQAKEETSGGGAKRGVTTGADNASFIRFFAALDFEATCWNGPDGRVKQDAEAEIIEFPTVLYRVVGGRGEGGDCLQEVGRFHR